MYKKVKREKYLSSRIVFKGVIRFLLFRYGHLTAKQIQEKLGLKRQTTYNYLKELVEEEKIGVSYKKLDTHPNLSVATYSVLKHPLPGSKETNLSEKVKQTSQSDVELMERIKNGLDMSLAAILEIQAIMRSMPQEDFVAYVKSDPNVWGFFSITFLLNEDEYGELQTEFKKLLDRLDKKWKERSSQDTKAENVFTFTFYKTIA